MLRDCFTNRITKNKRLEMNMSEERDLFCCIIYITGKRKFTEVLLNIKIRFDQIGLFVYLCYLHIGPCHLFFISLYKMQEKDSS